MEPELLSHSALDCAVARVLGWRQVDEKSRFGTAPEGGRFEVPTYHEDETACFRDLLPWMRERGWSYTVADDYPANDRHFAEFYCQDGKGPSAYGATAAEAISRAFLFVMTQEPTDA